MNFPNSGWAQNHGLNAAAGQKGQAGEFTRADGFLAYYEICSNIKKASRRRMKRNPRLRSLRLIWLHPSPCTVSSGGHNSQGCVCPLVVSLSPSYYLHNLYLNYKSYSSYTAILTLVELGVTDHCLKWVKCTHKTCCVGGMDGGEGP